MIKLAQKTGLWTAMDDVENGVIPDNLQQAFENYQNFSKGYRKTYLSWLNSAKREDTKQKKNRRNHKTLRN